MTDDEREAEIRRWYSNDPDGREQVFLLRRLDESRALSEKQRVALVAWKKVFPQHGLVAPQFLDEAERLTAEVLEGKK